MVDFRPHSVQRCLDGLEQYCEATGMVGTYAGTERKNRSPHPRRLPSQIVVDERSTTLKVSRSSTWSGCGSVACAGITTHPPPKPVE
jgi:uncharacterized zinc-type alcohol dehydrogenase-like protein